MVSSHTRTRSPNLQGGHYPKRLGHWNALDVGAAQSSQEKRTDDEGLEGKEKPRKNRKKTTKHKTDKTP